MIVQSLPRENSAQGEFSPGASVEKSMLGCHPVTEQPHRTATFFCKRSRRLLFHHSLDRPSSPPDFAADCAPSLPFAGALISAVALPQFLFSSAMPLVHRSHFFSSFRNTRLANMHTTLYFPATILIHNKIKLTL